MSFANLVKALEIGFKRVLAELVLKVDIQGIESMKIADTEGTLINPATKENQETMISKLDGILSKDSFKVKDSSDNIINPATEDTLSAISSKVDVALSTRASESTLSGIKTQTDKLKFDDNNNLYTRRERVIDIAESYAETSPAASQTYYTNSVAYSGADEIWVYVLADQPLDVVVEGSFDNSNFYPIAGYSISSSEFQTNQLNNILVNTKIPYVRVKLTTGSTAPSSINAWIVRVY